ncbi:MAG: D-glycero-beta-D-manno-heptose 1-phosphate adenylyltransferase [Saprospiraceae bacterium]|nr:D-glycero-beta-D-manno-heptose 1-phosphate adenylyltransferase [Saprospiraceae bacterium]
MIPNLQPLQKIQNKILDWENAQKSCRFWKDLGEEIVFTNGCFDLVHYGHIHYLCRAASLGQRLIIGMNSTTSVSELKGEHRPIKDELSRVYTMASLEFVDLIVIFNQDTPKKLIEYLRPDVLVKGGDWAIKDIVGADFVQATGGKVFSLDYLEGYSTTSLEQKIIQANTK